MIVLDLSGLKPKFKLPQTTSPQLLVGTACRILKSKGFPSFAEKIIQETKEIHTYNETLDVISKYMNVRR